MSFLNKRISEFSLSELTKSTKTSSLLMLKCSTASLPRNPFEPVINIFF